MKDEKKALIEKFWAFRKAEHRAETRRVFAIEQVIAQPGRAEELLERALAAADEVIEARLQADLTAHDLNDTFPPMHLEQPVVGAWEPIIRMMALLSRRPPDDTPQAPPSSER